MNPRQYISKTLSRMGLHKCDYIHPTTNGHGLDAFKRYCKHCGREEWKFWDRSAGAKPALEWRFVHYRKLSH